MEIEQLYRGITLLNGIPLIGSITSILLSLFKEGGFLPSLNRLAGRYQTTSESLDNYVKDRALYVFDMLNLEESHDKRQYNYVGFSKEIIMMSCARMDLNSTRTSALLATILFFLSWIVMTVMALLSMVGVERLLTGWFGLCVFVVCIVTGTIAKTLEGRMGRIGEEAENKTNPMRYVDKRA